MKQISIIFSKHTSPNAFSSLIMWGLNCNFSHVAIKLVDGDTNQVVYYQASGLAVNCVSEAAFLAEETIVYQKDFQVSDDAFVKGKTFLIQQLGKPYGMPAIFGFAYQILMLMIFKKKVANPAQANGTQWVCSQLGAGFIEASDNVTLDVSDMTPLELYETVPTLPDNWQVP